VRLAADVSFSTFVLRLKGIEVLLQTLVVRYARIDRVVMDAPLRSPVDDWTS
jgi:hypothetical protein